MEIIKTKKADIEGFMKILLWIAVFAMLFAGLYLMLRKLTSLG